MKVILLLLMLPILSIAQPKVTKQLVALTISYEPDQTTSPTKYFLVAAKLSAVSLKVNQTFVLRSAWKAEGDSVVNIGTGTIQSINANDVEMNATLAPGKKTKKGDMAVFLVPLSQPKKDTLFFKLARFDISLTSIDDSSFYKRNTMLKSPQLYPQKKLVEAIANDISYTGKALSDQSDSQNQLVDRGIYKGKKLFDVMQKATANDVLQFIRYIYARPDRYSAHTWRASETFATWVVAGAPTIK